MNISNTLVRCKCHPDELTAEFIRNILVFSAHFISKIYRRHLDEINFKRRHVNERWLAPTFTPRYSNGCKDEISQRALNI